MRMADARKRLGLIAAIIVAGSLATAYTDHFITTREKEMGGEFEETSLDGISGTVEEMIQETEILAENFSQEAEADAAAPFAGAARMAAPEGESEALSDEELSADGSPEAAAGGVQLYAVTPEENAAGVEEAAPETQGADLAAANETAADVEPGVAAAAYSAGPGISASAYSESREGTENDYTQWQHRLSELDNQIQKMRDEQTGSAAISIKALAETELNLWEKELSSIYNGIMERLDELGRKELARTQREWMNQRDAAAEKVIPSNSGSSIESAEYTASLAESTRARAYALLEEYQDYLKRP